MPAIITDQFRILNAETFAKSLTGIGTTAVNYYTFLGHPNPTNVSIEEYGDPDWGSPNKTPEPRDSFQQEDRYHDSMLFLKKVNKGDIARVVRRINWTSGTIYDMYRNDYNIQKGAPQSNSKTLYDANYYVVNSEYKVYMCINNGENPDNPDGQKSLVEPNFVDKNVQTIGAYTWKYMYSIPPADIIKFVTEDYIPLPQSWGDTVATEDIKSNAKPGHILTAIVKKKGSGYEFTTGGTSLANVDILGDGTGGKCTVNISNGEVESVKITDGGSGYTRAFINFVQTFNTNGGTDKIKKGTGAEFEVIVPPKGGHGNDIYREMGGLKVMIYSKYQTDPDFLVGNTFSRVGIVKNPTKFGDKVSLFDQSAGTNLGAMKLAPVQSGVSTSATTYPLNAEIRQQVGVGSTAVGYVASWDGSTGILRYYQPVGLSTLSNNGFRRFNFVGLANTISCADADFSGTALAPDINFDGQNSMTVGGKFIELGQTFENGIANPDVEMYSGDIIYIDNRAPITRSSSQKEEVKIVVEF